MKRIDWSQASPEQQQLALQRPSRRVQSEIQTVVSRIVEQVRADGDAC